MLLTLWGLGHDIYCTSFCSFLSPQSNQAKKELGLLSMRYKSFYLTLCFINQGSESRTVPASMTSNFRMDTYSGTEMPVFRARLNTGLIRLIRSYQIKYRILTDKCIPDRNKKELTIRSKSRSPSSQ